LLLNSFMAALCMHSSKPRHNNTCLEVSAKQFYSYVRSTAWRLAQSSSTATSGEHVRAMQRSVILLSDSTLTVGGYLHGCMDCNMARVSSVIVSQCFYSRRSGAYVRCCLNDHS
jgi:hypothetical protein